MDEFGQLDNTRGILDDDYALRRVVEEVLRFGTPFPNEAALRPEGLHFRRPHDLAKVIHLLSGEKE